MVSVNNDGRLQRHQRARRVLMTTVTLPPDARRKASILCEYARKSPNRPVFLDAVRRYRFLRVFIDGEFDGNSVVANGFPALSLLVTTQSFDALAALSLHMIDGRPMSVSAMKFWSENRAVSAEIRKDAIDPHIAASVITSVFACLVDAKCDIWVHVDCAMDFVRFKQMVDAFNMYHFRNVFTCENLTDAVNALSRFPATESVAARIKTAMEDPEMENYTKHYPMCDVFRLFVGVHEFYKRV